MEKYQCESCNEINKIEHQVLKVFPASHSQHLVQMKTLPQEGAVLKILSCGNPCFLCVGEKHGIPIQEQYDADKMYTDLIVGKEEMKSEVLHNWENGIDTKEAFARYQKEVPIILCIPNNT